MALGDVADDVGHGGSFVAGRRSAGRAGGAYHREQYRLAGATSGILFFSLRPKVRRRCCALDACPGRFWQWIADVSGEVCAKARNGPIAPRRAEAALLADWS